jgi:3-isopropylmalate dehydrogenase
VGPEVIGASLDLLDVVTSATGHRFELRFGGDIGVPALRATGQALTDEVVDFCRNVFDAGGAVLCGPGGGRFVYELRRQFDLYCKLVPLRPVRALRDTGVLRPEALANVDVLVIRENVGGLYLGEFGFEESGGLRRAYHCFHYDDAQVSRILGVAVRVARMRRGRLCVVTKPGGAPSISEIWRSQAERLVPSGEIELRILEVDTACYQLVAEAHAFDVVVAPNMFGDVLADAATLLLGSRGMSCSANFADGGRAVYQTGHGAAHDLARSDRANPIGQILSLAMMLQESFDMPAAAAAVHEAVEAALEAGWRTPDIAAPGCRLVGTREIGRRIGDALRERLGQTSPTKTP